MIVISRHKTESIIINHDLTITVVDIRGDRVHLGVEQPKEVPVHHNEVYEAIRRNAKPATAAKETLPPKPAVARAKPLPLEPSDAAGRAVARDDFRRRLADIRRQLEELETKVDDL
jgi:carbon storage regulator